jgi:S-adenosylmethionine hydrolase
MSVVTLLTDFGTKDAFVGIMKGVILNINPGAAIVDITHGIEPQDTTQAAFTIRHAYRFFPEGSVHLIVVDPGVGSDRDILAIRQGTHRFVAPNNGVLTLILKETKVEDVIRVQNSEYFIKPVSHTFHGRDIFAPVGAYLSAGVPIQKLGAPFETEKIIRLTLPAPQTGPRGEITGTVIAVDRFGNLITNIDWNVIEKFHPDAHSGDLTFQFGGFTVEGMATSYSSGRKDLPVVIVGSMGYFEIAVYNDNAQKRLNLGKGDPVTVSLAG